MPKRPHWIRKAVDELLKEEGEFRIYNTDVGKQHMADVIQKAWKSRSPVDVYNEARYLIAEATINYMRLVKALKFLREIEGGDHEAGMCPFCSFRGDRHMDGCALKQFLQETDNGEMD